MSSTLFFTWSAKALHSKEENNSTETSLKGEKKPLFSCQKIYLLNSINYMK